jgi:hypothetical protein
VRPKDYKDNGRKIAFAASFLKSGAAQAWRQKWINDTANISKTFADFKREFLDAFKTVVPGAKAKGVIRSMKQGNRTRVEDYIHTFNNYAGDTGFNDQALSELFLIGLNNHLCERILMTHPIPTVLKDLQEKAAELSAYGNLQ